MPISLTYVAVAVLTYLGVDNAQSVVDASVVVFVAVVALYGRYKAGGLHWTGWRL